MVSKIKNLVNGEGEKIIEPFYVDLAMQKSYAKTSTDVVDKLNMMGAVWEAVTKKKIESIDEARAIIHDPDGYWRSTKIEENIEQKRPHTIHLLDEGFAPTAIQTLLRLPEGFERVTNAVTELRKNEINWKDFTLIEGSFQLSPHFLNRMEGRIFFHAVSPLQKKRLAIAKKLIATLKELDSLLADEAREAGVHESKIDRALKKVAHIGPVPFCLKVVGKSIPGQWAEVEQELAVNEKWVLKGNAIYADEIGLGYLRKDPKAALPKHNPIVYLKYKRTFGDGSRTVCVVPKAEKDLAYVGSRESNVEFQPGEFVVDQASGKLVLRED